jgi:hypothetical protein
VLLPAAPPVAVVLLSEPQPMSAAEMAITEA